MALFRVVVVMILGVSMSLALNDVVDVSDLMPVAGWLWKSFDDGDRGLDLAVDVLNLSDHLGDVLNNLERLLNVDLSHDGSGNVDDLLDLLIDFLLDADVVEFPVSVLLRHGLIVNAWNAPCPGDLLDVGLLDHDLLLDDDRLSDVFLDSHDLGLLGDGCDFEGLLDMLDS